MNKQRIYNVPMIVNYVDNFGNRSDLTDVSENINTPFIDFRSKGHGDLHPGDILIAEVEFDPSFDESEYDIFWNIFGFDNKAGNIADVQITNQHVGEQMELRFQVISKKDWHRQHGLDDFLGVIFRVLPPPD